VVAPTRERSDLIDALRGFSLLGVCLTNFTWTAHWVSTPPHMRGDAAGASLDPIFGFLGAALIGYKFLTIFCILFGTGFALMLRRIEERGRHAERFFIRRLGVLFLIGVLHLGLLWYGDILHGYAILGLLLLALRRASDKTILILSVILITVVPALLDAQATLSSGRGGSGSFGSGNAFDARFAAYTGGSYSDVLRANFGVWFHYLTDDGARLWTGILGRMLLGCWIGRRRLLERAGEHLAFWRRAAVAGLAIGLVVNISAEILALTSDVNVWSPGRPAWAVLVRTALITGQVVLALGYMGAFVLIWESRGRPLLAVMSSMGRMALTNYLLQTAVMLFILYDLGLGLLGKLSLAADMAFAASVFAVQVVLSAWWLRRFRFGPVEWIWRSLTYGRAQPMRRAPAAGSPEAA
jgi:uncharacterized protein